MAATARTIGLLAILATASFFLTPVNVAADDPGGPAPVGYQVSIAPCRIADTRPSQGGSGIIAAGTTRAFRVMGTEGFPAQGGKVGGCGIPGFAAGNVPRVTAIIVNVTAITPSGNGNLVAFPGDGVAPLASTVNYNPSFPALANGVVVPVRQTAPQGDDIKIKANFGSVHVALDVVGYFTPFIHETVNVTSNATNDLILERDGIVDQQFGASWFSVIDGATGQEQMRIESDVEGSRVLFAGQIFPESNELDYAEMFAVSDPAIEPGDVVSLDPERPGHILRTTTAAAPGTLGVVSTNPAIVTGAGFKAEEAADPNLASLREAARAAGDALTARKLSVALREKMEEQLRPVALAGRVPTKATAAFGAIRPGDLLTSSPVPGVAMRASSSGPVIGIALEPLAAGQKKILMFVNRSHYTVDRGAEIDALRSGDVAAAAPGASGVETADGSLLAAGTRANAGGSSGFIVEKVARDGAATPLASIDEEGNLRVAGAIEGAGQPVSEDVEAGDLLVVDPDRPGTLRRGARAADPGVVGIASGSSEDGAAPVALSGIVRCKVDAAYGAIAVGDLLATSPTAGHAMAAPDAVPGTIVAKALEPLDSGTGVIRALVMPR